MLTIDEVVDVAKAGGKVVSPNTDIDVIIKTKSLDLISILGFATTTEAFTAKHGADALKLFPARFSSVYIKSNACVLPPKFGSSVNWN